MEDKLTPLAKKVLEVLSMQKRFFKGALNPTERTALLMACKKEEETLKEMAEEALGRKPIKQTDLF